MLTFMLLLQLFHYLFLFIFTLSLLILHSDIWVSCSCNLASRSKAAWTCNYLLAFCTVSCAKAVFNRVAVQRVVRSKVVVVFVYLLYNL